MSQSQPPAGRRVDLETTGSSLETARISGQRSAILASLAVAGVLIAVVWAGISGRTTAPPSHTFKPVAQLGPTGEPAIQPTISPAEAPSPVPDAIAYELRDVFGVYAELGDAQYATILSEPEPGHLRGRLQLPLPLSEKDGSFVFQQFTSASRPGISVPIADWPINLDALEADSPEFYAVNATLPARRTIVDAPRPVANGFKLTVVGKRNGNLGEFSINVRIGPNRQLQGNDGILGWPVVSQLDQPGSDQDDQGEIKCSGYVGVEAVPPRPDPAKLDC